MAIYHWPDLTDVEVAISPEFERMASEQDRYGEREHWICQRRAELGTAEPDQSTFLYNTLEGIRSEAIMAGT